MKMGRLQGLGGPVKGGPTQRTVSHTPACYKEKLKTQARVPQRRPRPLLPGRVGSPSARWTLAAWSRRGRWYLFVLPRQVGAAEGRLWVHGLVVHVSQ